MGPSLTEQVCSAIVVLCYFGIGNHTISYRVTYFFNIIWQWKISSVPPSHVITGTYRSFVLFMEWFTSSSSVISEKISPSGLQPSKLLEKKKKHDIFITLIKIYSKHSQSFTDLVLLKVWQSIVALCLQNNFSESFMVEIQHLPALTDLQPVCSFVLFSLFIEKIIPETFSRSASVHCSAWSALTSRWMEIPSPISCEI